MNEEPPPLAPVYCVACKAPIPPDAEPCPRCGQTQKRETAAQLAAEEATRVAAQKQAARDNQRVQQMRYDALRQAGQKRPGGLSIGFGIGIGIVFGCIAIPLVITLLGGAACLSVLPGK